jgi:hypothetical protein
MLSSSRFDWGAATVVSCPGLEFVTLSAAALRLPESPNPFALPEEGRVDAVLLSASWYWWLVNRHPERAGEVIRNLERRADTLVGLDLVDEFDLALPPRAVERTAVVLKGQGIYRDRDLYNYEVGARVPGANWTHKSRPKAERYSGRDLEKLWLSVPCFMLDFAAVRRGMRRREAIAARPAARRAFGAMRLVRDLGDFLLVPALRLSGAGPRHKEVHCVVGLTHVQRIGAMRELAGFSGDRGIVLLRNIVGGTSYGTERLPDAVYDEIVASATPYLRSRISRTRYLLDSCRHRVVVAPTGFGELGQRHGEALLSGAALVCQDLSHVEMMLPLEHRVNAAFCRPDLSDLRSTVRGLLDDDELRRRIAREGRRNIVAWSKGWREHLYHGIEAPIRAAVDARLPNRGRALELR